MKSSVPPLSMFPPPPPELEVEDEDDEEEEEEDELELLVPLELVLLEVDPVPLEPKRFVVARNVDVEPVVPDEPLEVEDAELEELEAVEEELDELEEEEVLPEVFPPPPPPPRIPRNCGATSDTNLSAEVTPVSRSVRSRVPEATTAVRTSSVPLPDLAGSVACFQVNQPAPARMATTSKMSPLLDFGRLGA